MPRRTRWSLPCSERTLTQKHVGVFRPCPAQPGPAAVVSVAGPVPSHERSYRTDPSQGAPDDDLINPPGLADKITAELDMSLNYVYLRGMGIVVCVAREMLVTDQGKYNW